MKSRFHLLALSAGFVLTLVLAGCAEDNNKNAMAGTGPAPSKGQGNLPGPAEYNKVAKKLSTQNDPMKSGAYQKAIGQ